MSAFGHTAEMEVPYAAAENVRKRYSAVSMFSDHTDYSESEDDGDHFPLERYRHKLRVIDEDGGASDSFVEQAATPTQNWGLSQGFIDADNARNLNIDPFATPPPSPDQFRSESQSPVEHGAATNNYGNPFDTPPISEVHPDSSQDFIAGVMNATNSEGLTRLENLWTRTQSAQAALKATMDESRAKRFVRNFAPAANSALVVSLNALVQDLGSTGHRILKFPDCLHNVDRERMRYVWGQCYRALRNLSALLSQMAVQFGSCKYVKGCRSYVVAAIEGILSNYLDLELAIEMVATLRMSRYLTATYDISLIGLYYQRLDEWRGLTPSTLDRVRYFGEKYHLPRPTRILPVRPRLE